MLNDRLQPHDVAAEESVLAALMVDPDVFPEVEATRLCAADFYRDHNRWIYEAIVDLRLRGDSVNTLTVAHALKGKDFGGAAFLSKITTNLPTTVGISSVASSIREDKIRRNLISACAQATRSAHEPGSLNELLQEAGSLVGMVVEQGTPLTAVHIREVLKGLFDRPVHEQGVLTGWSRLNRLLGSLRRDSLNIFAARPSKGKTSLGIQLLVDVTKAGAKALMFSAEMSTQQIVTRMVACQSGVDSRRLEQQSLNEQEQSAMNKAMGKLADLNQWTHDRSVNIDDVALQARAHKLKAGCDIVVADYLQLFEANIKGNRTEQVTYVSRKLKGIARDLDVPVVAMAQLNRGTEGRSDTRPFLSDLRESGSIEQDADTVTFLHDNQKAINTKDHDVELLVDKNRMGQTGIVTLRFYPASSQFVDTGVTQ